MLNCNDMKRLHEILEAGRSDSENPDYKIVKYLAEMLYRRDTNDDELSMADFHFVRSIRNA